MAEIILFISVFSIILLILLQNISLRLYTADGIIADIDYSLFRVSLKKRKTEGKQQDIQRKNKRRLKPLLLSLKSVLPSFMASCDVTLYKLSIKAADLEPHKFTVIYKNLLSFFSAILLFTVKNARSVTIYGDSPVFTTEPEERLRFDISISCRLYKLLYSLLIFAFSFIKHAISDKKKETMKMKKKGE